MRSETNNINDTYQIYPDIDCLNKKINFVFFDKKYSNSLFRYRMTQLNRWDKVIFQFDIIFSCSVMYTVSILFSLIINIAILYLDIKWLNNSKAEIPIYVVCLSFNIGWPSLEWLWNILFRYALFCYVEYKSTYTLWSLIYSGLALFRIIYLGSIWAYCMEWLILNLSLLFTLS